MKISYDQFHSTCESFAKDALDVLITLSADWKQDPNVEPVPALFKDDDLRYIFHDSMAEFLISTVEIEPPTKK